MTRSIRQAALATMVTRSHPPAAALCNQRRSKTYIEITAAKSQQLREMVIQGGFQVPVRWPGLVQELQTQKPHQNQGLRRPLDFEIRIKGYRKGKQPAESAG
jgi:hypothetical protein